MLHVHLADVISDVGPVTELIIQTLAGTPTPAKIHSTSADWLFNLKGGERVLLLHHHRILFWNKTAKVSIINVEFDGVPLRARETAELHLNNTKIYNVADEKHYAAEAKVLSVSTNCEFRGCHYQGWFKETFLVLCVQPKVCYCAAEPHVRKQLRHGRKKNA